MHSDEREITLLVLLKRIAKSQEIIANDIIERKARENETIEKERNALVSDWQYLQDMVKSTGDKFGSADNACYRMRNDDMMSEAAKKNMREHAVKCEDEYEQAREKLRRFEALHPELRGA